MSTVLEGRLPVVPERAEAVPRVPARIRSLFRHSSALTRRNMMKVAGDPGLLLDATVMPMIFALLFVFAFGGAIAGSQSEYRQYLIAGIMVLTVTIVSRTTGIGLAVDFQSGAVDRFRSLPIARSALLTGRITADVIRMVIAQAVILTFGLAIGFRIHTTILQVFGAILLLTSFGVALSWVAAFIGLSARSIQTTETVTSLWLAPLQFGSSLFVPPSTMPGWLQAFVRFNPMTLVADATRSLLIGGSLARPVIGTLIWTGGLILIFMPLSVWRYSRRR